MKLIWSILLTTCILLILACQIEGGRSRTRERSTRERSRRRQRRRSPPNQPPRFTYCPSSRTLSTSALSAAITWTHPTVSDDYSTPTITQTSGHRSGTVLGQGDYRVVYTARDSHGSTSSCSFTVTVDVIRCPTIPTASNRMHSCTYGVQGGSQCSFSCQTGYRLNGGSTVHCSVSTRTWSASFPTCSAMTCNPPLPNPANGEVSCTDGNRYMSMCFFMCLPGFEIPPGQIAARYCNGVIWSGSQPVCQDVEPPVFSVCPSSFDINVNSQTGSGTVITYDTPQATDNSGHVNTEMVKGKSSGSQFGNGVTTVQYKAEDPAGNRNECTFNINVIFVIMQVKDNK